MSDPFSSRGELRRYVEAQLKHPGLHDRLDLSIAFQNPRRLLDAPPLHPLWWTIESSKMDRTQHLLSRHYLLEARYEEREFVIWFGRLTGFRGPSPRDMIRPAVHLTFSTFDPRVSTLGAKLTAIVHRLWASTGTERAATVHGEQQSGDPEEYSLGAAIAWMLEHEDHADVAWDPVVYPLNGGRY